MKETETPPYYKTNYEEDEMIEELGAKIQKTIKYGLIVLTIVLIFMVYHYIL